MVRAFIGKRVDLIKVSQLGFSILFLGEDKKLAKLYYVKEAEKSYNVSVVLDRSNKITGFEIYEVVQTDSQGASIERVDVAPPSVAHLIEKDVSQIIEA